MNCASCGRTNRAAARFCGGCGNPLAARCPACGIESEPDARFCDGCGASLVAGRAQKADETVARKIVTIVFADLIGSTALHERLDPELVRRVMDRYYRTVRVPVEAHGGTVVQLLGDGVMCAFGVPRVAEDDAIRAVRAAVAVQDAFREFARTESAVAGSVGLRVAVNTGEVVVSDDFAAGIGDPLNVAARLQQEAHDGDVLISESTRRLVSERVTLEPLGTFSLKGRTETVTAYRVVSLERPRGASATAFVGRDDELRRIIAVHQAAVADRRARLAVILGSPGLGKSRLIDEVVRRLGDGATALTAQCDAAGGATFAPVARALRAHLRIEEGAGGDATRAAIEAALPDDDAERARIAQGIAALLAGTPASPEETFFVVRRLFAALAVARPVVLAIDDLQWAEPLLLDLTEHLVQWGADLPLLVLAAARPELRETRSSLATSGGLVADLVTLAGLDAAAATRLAANVIGADQLPAAVAGRVLATSEGNPLFVGELVRMLVQDGALKREGDRWTAGVELARLEMPPTIQALLAARIERLRPEERTVLERAAVVGRQFSRAAVTHLLPHEVADLDARLEALRRSELIEPDTGWFLGDPALRFHHVLIRDAAYRRVLKNTRAELHGRFADWLETRAGEAVEHDETIGWHLEQAHQHLRELGPIDDQGRALGERAARYLAAAGRRALARDDLPLAANLLGRALARLDAADPARADLALDWCEALLAAGDVGPAAGAIDELGKFIGGSARLRAWHTCFAGQLAALTDPQALRATSDAVAAAAESLASLSDAAGEAKAHFVQAVALSRLGKVGACEAALDRALAAARRADDRRRSNAVLAGAPSAALWGPSPVTRASGRCLDVVRVLRITQGAPAVEAVALRCQGVLEALRGRTEAARRMIASSRRMVEELGITHRLLEADVFAGRIDLLEGDAAAAERCLRSAYEGLREQGLGIDAAQAAALLGRALLAQDRAAEAEALSHESEALAGDDLQAAIAWRGVRAEALARRGEHGSAVEFARAAVDIAAATDALLDHADARLALAVALRAAGRTGDAVAEEARAIELWEAKGATLLAERARREKTSLEREAAAPEPPPRVRRLVPPNAATALAARVDAANVARDADAIAALFADRFECVHHPSGRVLGREDVIAYFRTTLAVATELTFTHEPLATLGDRLVLVRATTRLGELAEDDLEFGPSNHEELVLIEVDARGQHSRSEVFPIGHLGDAVTRLYERSAELLPDGSDRVRAAATARSVAVTMTLDLERFATALDPDHEFVDHRPLGFPSRHGVEQQVQALRTIIDASTDIGARIDDILGLNANALLLRCTQFGTARTGGGAYERSFLILRIFGPRGLATRQEMFAADRDDDAVARFVELTEAHVTAPSPAVHRRVRANAAIANVRKLEAAVAARDADALVALIADESTMVEHSTNADFDRSHIPDIWRALLKIEDVRLHYEPLATLGDSLALCRQTVSGSGAGRFLDTGPWDSEKIILVEVDAGERRRRTEFFAPRRLGDAIARLYERYADLLPDGPERDRGAATTRSVLGLLGPPDRWPFAPDVEFVDQRIVGVGSLRGAEPVRGAVRALLDLTESFATRVDDILGLRSNALLVGWTTTGTDRAGGGVFERRLWELWCFGDDGLLTRWEQFDIERKDEALARFDALVIADAHERRPRRRLRPNAATANAARLDAAIAARDKDAISALYAEEAGSVHHPSGLTYDRQGTLATFHFLLTARDPTCREEPLATLGDSLALFRWSLSSRGFAGSKFDVGAYDMDEIHLAEVDAEERRIRTEVFATDQLGDAVARLYERYAELLPEGPARVRAAMTARAAIAGIGNDRTHLARVGGVLHPTVEFVDHQLIGFPVRRGVDEVLDLLHSMWDVSTNVGLRVDDVLCLRPNGVLMLWNNSGTTRVGGGAYEREFLVLSFFGPDGRTTRVELFAPDRDAEAIARFDALTPAPAGKPHIENAATRAIAHWADAWADHDWARIASVFAPGFQLFDRRKTVRLDLDADQHRASLRMMFEMTSCRVRSELLATRGERLALARARFELGDQDVGPSEVEFLFVLEMNEHGARVASVIFDPDDLDAAYTELDDRYAAGEAAPYAATLENIRRIARGVAARDWDLVASTAAPDFVLEDRRHLGLLETMRSPDAYVAAMRTLADLAPRATLRMDHILALDDRGSLIVGGWVGSPGEPFEIRSVSVAVSAPDGRPRATYVYDVDQLDTARALYHELRSKPGAVPRDPFAALAKPNAATRANDRLQAAFAARDWSAMRAELAADARIEERRYGVVSHDADAWITDMRRIAQGSFGELTDWRYERQLVGSTGERVDLERVRWSGLTEGAPFDVEHLAVTEVDENGRITALVTFDVDDSFAATREAWTRTLACDATAAAVARPIFELSEGINRRDRALARGVLADELVVDDHRRAGMGRIEGPDAYVASIAVLWDLAPDLRTQGFGIAHDRHGSVNVARTFGTLADGGAFESYYVTLTTVAVGSSRVDLQACKLEYSIVSPK